MTMKKRLMQAAGFILVIAAFYFIGLKLSKLNLASLTEIISLPLILFLIAASIGYAILNLIPAYNWQLILSTLSIRRFIPSELLRIIQVYLKTALAKYLPSNVLHFAGRHLLKNELGLTHEVLAFTTFFEIIFLIVISFGIAVVGIFTANIRIPSVIPALLLSRPFMIVFLVVVLLLLIIIIVVLRLHKDRIKNWGNMLKQFEFQRIVWLLLSYSLFFLTISLLFYLLCFFFMKNQEWGVSFLPVFFAYTLAWLTGYVVPGAPGGAGIRETVLIVLLSPVIGESQAVISAILLRLVMIAGDVWAFFLSWISIFKEEIDEKNCKIGKNHSQKISN